MQSAIRHAHAADPSLDKLLSDNRDRAFAQSAATRNGVVAPFIDSAESDSPEPCTKCDPPGILWTFRRGESPSHPEHGQWNECECYGTDAQRDREKAA